MYHHVGPSTGGAMTALTVEDHEPPWSLGDRIRKVRRTLKLDQDEFGDLLGVKPATISKWERDEGRPGDPVATAKAVALLAARAGLAWATAQWILDIRSVPPPEYAAWDSNPEPTDNGLLAA